MQNISPIKQRILQYIDTLNISKRDFYAFTGISRGTLESESSITEITLAKFIEFYPEINPAWLLTGKGNQFVFEEGRDVVAPIKKEDLGLLKNISKTQTPDNIIGCEMCKMKDKVIDSQEKQIETLSKLIYLLEEKVRTK